MKVALTFVYLFLATFTTVIAHPLQQRDASQVFASLANLDNGVTNFDNAVPSDNFLDLDIIGGVLELLLGDIIGDYGDCSDAYSNAGPLSNTDANDAITKYIATSNSFSNGLNRMSTAQKNAPSSNGGLVRAVNGLLGDLGHAVTHFVNNLNGSGNVPNNRQGELNTSNNQLQQSIQNAAAAF